jgi:hypothetical protein
MKRYLPIVLLPLVLAVLAAACTPVPPAPGQIRLGTTEFDFGTIPNDRPVSHTFQVRNAGQGPLEITSVSTSCGCTTAQVDREHVEPGETAALTVTYDPQAHGGETGRFMRVVYVRSSDPQTPEASLTVHVTVTAP